MSCATVPCGLIMDCYLFNVTEFVLLVVGVVGGGEVRWGGGAVGKLPIENCCDS